MNTETTETIAVLLTLRYVNDDQLAVAAVALDQRQRADLARLVVAEITLRALAKAHQGDLEVIKSALGEFR